MSLSCPFSPIETGYVPRIFINVTEFASVDDVLRMKNGTTQQLLYSKIDLPFYNAGNN